MIFEAHGFPKVSVALIAGDSSFVRDAERNGRPGIARRIAPVPRVTLTVFVTRRAHVSLCHGRRQIRDDVIMLTVLQQVDPLGCGYLDVKHDALAPQTRIHHYHIL